MCEHCKATGVYTFRAWPGDPWLCIDCYEAMHGVARS